MKPTAGKHDMLAGNRTWRPDLRQPVRWRRWLPSLACAAGVFAVSGCATAPAPWLEAPAVDTGAWRAPVVRAEFARTLAPAFHAVHGVVFTCRGRAMTALGVTDVDRAAGAFAAACLTPSGLTLFNVAMCDGVVTTRFAAAAFNPFGDAGRAVGTDIWRVHFDCLPDTNAIVTNTGHELRFTSAREGGALVHVFAGADRLLARKYACDAGGHIIWDVQYADYRRVGEYRFPFLTRLTNFRYGYTLDVRAKEIGLPALHQGGGHG